MANHFSGYNCVLTAAYNYLRLVCGFDFDFALLGMPRGFFNLSAFEAGLTNGKPCDIVTPFLNRIGVKMIFPDMGSIAAALQYADRTLAGGGVLPAAINLRYSVLDPTRFDSDYWNFQLLVGCRGVTHYHMFDMFHGKYYDIDRAYLQKMINTRFNYRHDGKFTPFMQMEMDNDAQSRQAVAQLDIRNHLLTVMNSYDLAANLATADALLHQFKRRYLDPTQADDMYTEIYRIIGSQIVISKGRRQFADCLHLCFDSPSKEMGRLGPRWEQFTGIIPLILGRKDAGEYERLSKKLIDLFHFEYAAVQQALAIYEGGAEFLSDETIQSKMCER